MAKTENGVVTTTAEGRVVEVEAGQNILLDVASADLVVFSQDGSDLVVTSIADGASLVLEGFFSQAGTDLPPQLTLSDGSVISATEVTGLVEEFNPDLVAPAAGGPAAGAAPNGGGAGFSAFDDDGIGDGIGISGLLDPTELGFGDEVIAEEVGLILDNGGEGDEGEGRPPRLDINEIGLGALRFSQDFRPQDDEFSDSEFSSAVFAISDNSGDVALTQALIGLENPDIDSFIEFSQGVDVDFIELRNPTENVQSAAGEGDGTTSVSIIGPEGAPVTVDLPTVDIPAGGRLVLMQASGEGGVQTVYVVFDINGAPVDGGTVADNDAWPVGGDTAQPLGVLLSWALNGSVSEIDTFLANGAQFVPASLNAGWLANPDPAVALDIFGDSGTFNGQIATQEVVAPGIFDVYSPISLADLVDCSPIAETFFLDIEPNNIFARVDNADTDTAADWTTGEVPTVGQNNDVNDYNPQDPFNDNMNPGQAFGNLVGPDDETDTNGQNVIIAGVNDEDFINEGTGAIEGGRGQDFLIGDDGNNTLLGGGGNDFFDVLYGGDGSDSHNDYLDGGAGNDVMDGQSGGDVLIDDQGQDMMIGGTGTDIIFGRRDPIEDTMDGGFGNDLVSGDELDTNAQLQALIGKGSGTGDLLVGDETLFGGFGNDNFPTLASAALFAGGFGNDGFGNPQDYMRDIIVAGDDSDIIYGDNAGLAFDFGPEDISSFYFTIASSFNPYEFAFAYRNSVQWNYGGADLIYGGGGNDLIFGQGGDDGIVAGSGHDLVAGGSGNDKIEGNDGADSLYGDTGADTIYGGAGSDYMEGNEDADLMYGGTGNDQMSGGNDADIMYGDAGNDTMTGDAGDDRMSGGDGNDTMDGGTGNDRMSGGDGNDLVMGGLGADLIGGSDGDDTVQGGEGNDTAYGSAGLDTVTGDAGDDVLYGGYDEDDMSGGAGNDVMYGDNGDPIFGPSLEDDTMSGGTGNDTMYGEDDGDLMYGDAGDDVMYGEDGLGSVYGGDGYEKDTLYGGAGNDIMFGGTDNDLMYGGTGNDQMSGGTGNDQMSGGNDADIMYGDAGNDTMTGNDGSDDVDGNTGDDVLRWTAADNADGSADDYDGGDDTDTLELYFTEAEFLANEEAIAEFSNRLENGEDNVTLTIGAKTLTASNIEYVHVHVDGDEVPVLIDDSFTTDENTTLTEQLTAGVPAQDFITNDGSRTTVFTSPDAVTITMPGGGAAIVIAAADWVQVGDIWSVNLIDGADDYGILRVDATNPDAATVILEPGSAFAPMINGDVATVVFTYNAEIQNTEEAEVTINVNGLGDAVVAADDIVITNSGTEIFIPDYGLLSNDVPDGVTVGSVAAPAAEDVAGYVNVAPSGIPGDDVEFDYTATDGINSDNAGVDVEYQFIAGGLGLAGDDRDEIAIGSLGADTIVGGGGDDTIAGGAGDDRLFGGTGNALDDGGSNVFHYYGSDTAGVGGGGGNDGNDIIFDFDVNNDVINLDALFDALGAGSAEDRADLVNLVSDGTDTTITVDGEAGFSIALDNVDLGTFDGTLSAADLLTLKGISVSDES
ncbi:MAG: hypothetical protein ABJN40_09065 [Sneathiella sp.]